MPELDTSPAAHAIQMRLYRDAGPQRRAEMAAEMSDLVREICRSGIRSRHPDFSETEVTRELLRILYGRTGKRR